MATAASAHASASPGGKPRRGAATATGNAGGTGAGAGGSGSGAFVGSAFMRTIVGKAGRASHGRPERLAWIRENSIG